MAKAPDFVGSVTGTTTNGGNIALDLTALTGGLASRPANGDVIFVFGAVPSNTAGIDWAGYTSIDEGVNSGSTGRSALSYKVSDGTETTVTFTGDGSATSSVGAMAIVMRGLDPADVFSATATTATGSSTNPDPPSNTADYPETASLVFAFSRVNDATITVPTDYGNLVTVNAGADTNDVSLAFAWRGGRGTVAHDPPAFTGWSTGAWRAITVFCKPITPLIRFVGRQSGTALNGADVSLDLTTLNNGIAAAAIEGDLVLVTGGHVGASAGINTSGYTTIVNQTNTINQIVAWKIMGSTPDTTVDCEGGGDANDAVAYVAYVFRGCDMNTPIDVTSTTATGSGTTPNSPSITPVTDYAAVVSAICSATFSSSIASPLHWSTNNAQNDDTSDATAGLAHQSQGVAGAAVDPPSWTGAVSGAWCAVTIALRPKQLTLACAPSSVSISSTAAVLKTTMTAAPSSVAITPAAATFRKAKTMAAAPSSIAITGVAAGLRASRRIAAAPSSITLTLRAASLLVTRKITAAPSAITLTPSAAVLRASHKIAAAPSAITISAIDATLTHVAAAASILAEPSSIAITPTGAVLRATMLASPSSVSITAQAAGLRTARRVAAQPSTITLSPVAAVLRAQRELDALPSTVIITPSDATFTAGVPPAPATGAHDGRVLSPGTLLTRR